MVDRQIDYLAEVFTNNDYPIQFTKNNLERMAEGSKTCTREKKRLYISLPFKGDRIAGSISRRLNSTVKNTYNAATLHVSFQ